MQPTCMQLHVTMLRYGLQGRYGLLRHKQAGQGDEQRERYGEREAYLGAGQAADGALDARVQQQREQHQRQPCKAGRNRDLVRLQLQATLVRTRQSEQSVTKDRTCFTQEAAERVYY